jgi:hypothetical protein
MSVSVDTRKSHARKKLAQNGILPNLTKMKNTERDFMSKTKAQPKGAAEPESVKPHKQRKQLKIVVGQPEIDTAVKGSSKHCMITDSIKRDHGKRFVNILTDKNDVSFTDRKTLERYTFPMSPLGRASIYLFDEGSPVKPFTITLRNPKVRQRRAKVAPGETRKGRKIPSLVGAEGHYAAGVMPRPRSAEARKHVGRDRVFGAHIFKDELARLREQLGVAPSSESRDSMSC